jgi:hypothetical protein
MSIKATNFVRRLRGLTITEKAVAMILADHDSHKGEGSFPGMTTVADESCLKNRQTATDVVKRLVAKGVITTDSLSRGGRGKTTVYRFNYALTNCNPEVTVASDNCNSRIAVSTPNTATQTPVNCNPVEAKLQPWNPETATGELHEGVEGVNEKGKKEEAHVSFSDERTEELTDLVVEIATRTDRRVSFIPSNLRGIARAIKRKKPTDEELTAVVREMVQVLTDKNVTFAGGIIEGGLAGKLNEYKKAMAKQRRQEAEQEAARQLEELNSTAEWNARRATDAAEAELASADPFAS